MAKKVIFVVLYLCCLALNLCCFLMQLSFIKCDLEEMDFIMSMRGSNLTEQLLPLRHSFFIRKSR